MSEDKVKTERFYTPREYGWQKEDNLILYDCSECCFNVNHGDEECPNGHKLIWTGVPKHADEDDVEFNDETISKSMEDYDSAELGPIGSAVLIVGLIGIVVLIIYVMSNALRAPDYDYTCVIDYADRADETIVVDAYHKHGDVFTFTMDDDTKMYLELDADSITCTRFEEVDE